MVPSMPYTLSTATNTLLLPSTVPKSPESSVQRMRTAPSCTEACMTSSWSRVSPARGAQVKKLALVSSGRLARGGLPAPRGRGCMRGGSHPIREFMVLG